MATVVAGPACADSSTSSDARRCAAAGWSQAESGANSETCEHPTDPLLRHRDRSAAPLQPGHLQLLAVSAGNSRRCSAGRRQRPRHRSDVRLTTRPPRRKGTSRGVNPLAAMALRCEPRAACMSWARQALHRTAVPANVNKMRGFQIEFQRLCCRQSISLKVPWLRSENF